jgi:hypothetical protein
MLIFGIANVDATTSAHDFAVGHPGPWMALVMDVGTQLDCRFSRTGY